MLLIFKFFLFYLLVFLVLADDGNKSNSQIELLIEEYILENPEVIIKSLENYRSLQEAKIEEEQKFLINNYYAEKIYDSLPSSGNEAGSIIVTEFIDYNCGYCKKTLQIINSLLDRNNNIKIIFIDFPILSETSYIAAKGALAAFEQGAYFEFHSKLLNGNKKFSDDYIVDLAKDMNLDVSKFKKDMNSDLISKKLEKNIKFARDLNIRGTPSFIINKKVYPGAYKLDKLEEIIKK